MDPGLTRDQRMLQEAARDFLRGACPRELVEEQERPEAALPEALWREAAELGWLGLTLPEDQGGQGMDFVDLALFLEEAGRVCMPGPLVPSVVIGAPLVAETGREAPRPALLPGRAAGERGLACVLPEDGDLRVEPDGTLHGCAGFVADVHVADRLLVATRRDEDMSLWLVDPDAPGLRRTRLETLAGDHLFELVFDGVVPEDELGEGDVAAALDRATTRGTLAHCLRMVGGASEMLRLSLTHARSRRQFGRPIGAFQAVQHHCADMAIDLEGARLLSYQAAWRFDQGLPCRREVAMAKAWTSEAYRRISLLAHRVHGAVGFTMEHDLQLYSRRGKAAELAFGGPEEQYEGVASALGLRSRRPAR